ncbi:uncharacterized protein LOC141631823 [Silene latifolia]|uniref:uncharacterized protein LOC141631823 n=1 Tax=Silene latifolia TaxID=37657 RepID=UPI003D77C895
MAIIIAVSVLLDALSGVACRSEEASISEVPKLVKSICLMIDENGVPGSNLGLEPEAWFSNFFFRLDSDSFSLVISASAWAAFSCTVSNSLILAKAATNCCSGILDEEPELLQLTEEDVQSELDYWQQAVVGFVVGANPPWQVLEGFLKRIWNKYVIDKISFLPNGVFLARFQTEEMKLGSGYFLFDDKPLILKPWQPEIELTKDGIKSVPAWIRLQKLPLKFWGKSLPKLANLVGNYIKSDSANELKTRLGFARVMVELKLGQSFPKSIKFLDENKQVVSVDIVYEWKPSLCTKCKQLGHEKDQCRRNKAVTKANIPAAKAPVAQKVWRPITKPAVQIAPLIANSSESPVAKKTADEDENVTTPITRITNTSCGTISPIRQPRQGSDDSRNISASPHLMEELKGTCSPKKGIGVTDWSVSTNNAYHHGGRVWVIWKPHVFDVNFIKYDAQFIHVQVTNKLTLMQFYYTIIYAFNGVGERDVFERLGGNVTEAEIEPFYDCIHECGVMDMQATGAFYTWNNKQPPETRVYSRLDRLMVNQEWLDQFPEYLANFLPEGLFDHNPCLVSKGSMGGNQHKPFKYFNMWSAAEGFKESVSNVWRQWVYGNKMYRVVKKLKMLKPELKKINKNHFSDIEKTADIAQLRLKQIQEELLTKPGDLSLMQQEYDAHQHYISLYTAKMDYLKQKAKAHWLKEGDSNSAYFHGVLKA